MSMVVWIGITTLIFGAMAVQNFAANNVWAGRTAVFMSLVFDALWCAFTFRGAFA